MRRTVVTCLNGGMRYGLQTYREIAELAATGVCAVVPLGCTEQQGPHLPVDFDSWFAEALMLEAGDRVEAVHGEPVMVLPVIPLGPTPEHRGFGAGYLDLPVALHEAVVTATVESLAAQGFCDVVVWRGCGQHDLTAVVDALNGRYTSTRVHLPAPRFDTIWRSVTGRDVAGGHADSFTTSIMLARRAELVRENMIPAPSRLADWSDPNLDFTAYSDSGVIGDATQASRAFGEALWRECVRWAADYLHEVAANRRGAENM